MRDKLTKEELTDLKEDICKNCKNSFYECQFYCKEFAKYEIELQKQELYYNGGF